MASQSIGEKKMSEVDRLLYLNDLSKLHGHKNIRFCKTDFLEAEFSEISQLDHDVVLITGNSDYAITEDITRNVPLNIRKWYAENCLSNAEFIEPIPLGLENKEASPREGHGVGYPERASEKEGLLTRDTSNIKPTRGIYANYKIHTNPVYRTSFHQLCIQGGFIEIEEPKLSLEEFFNKMLDYKMIVCPIGNGVDTHRLWETLYSGRIPVTVKVGDYKIYEMYRKLPIVILENESDLLNEDLIYEKYESVKGKSLEYSDQRFWKNKIIMESA